MDLLDSDLNLWGYEVNTDFLYIRVNNVWYMKTDGEERWSQVRTGWQNHEDLDNPRSYFTEFNVTLEPATPEHIARVVQAKLTGKLDD